MRNLTILGAVKGNIIFTYNAGALNIYEIICCTIATHIPASPRIKHVCYDIVVGMTDSATYISCKKCKISPKNERMGVTFCVM